MSRDLITHSQRGDQTVSFWSAWDHHRLRELIESNPNTRTEHLAHQVQDQFPGRTFVAVKRKIHKIRMELGFSRRPHKVSEPKIADDAVPIGMGEHTKAVKSAMLGSRALVERIRAVYGDRIPA